ncbi:hypothetical protein EDB19DRAFT_1822621 [Suillus lakei]|nr:hypothetical protein EDB19DRAFT_1822621 [Suillus lakei]
MKQKYKEAEKPISVQSLNVQSARREKCQLDKAALASAVHPDFPPLAVKWQSIDYSGSDASDDINLSDDEAVSLLNPRRKAYKKKTTTILMTCPPVWQSKDFHRAIKEIREECNEQEALMTEDHVIGDSESSTDPNIDDLEQEEQHFNGTRVTLRVAIIQFLGDHQDDMPQGSQGHYTSRLQSQVRFHMVMKDRLTIETMGGWHPVGDVQSIG